MPAAAVLISPWSDLTHSFPSTMENTATVCYLLLSFPFSLYLRILSLLTDYLYINPASSGRLHPTTWPPKFAAAYGSASRKPFVDPLWTPHLPYSTIARNPKKMRTTLLFQEVSKLPKTPPQINHIPVTLHSLHQLQS